MRCQNGKRQGKKHEPLIPIRARSDSTPVSFEKGVARLFQTTLEEKIERLEEVRFVLGVDVLDALSDHESRVEDDQEERMKG